MTYYTRLVLGQTAQMVRLVLSMCWLLGAGVAACAGASTDTWIILPPSRLLQLYLSWKQVKMVSFNQLLYRWNVQRTNRENKGLISADRNNKATLLLTIPRSIIVVCYGFIPSNILYCYSVATKIALPRLGNPPCYDARIKDSICNHLTWRG